MNIQKLRLCIMGMMFAVVASFPYTSDASGSVAHAGRHKVFSCDHLGNQDFILNGLVTLSPITRQSRDICSVLYHDKNIVITSSRAGSVDKVVRSRVYTYSHYLRGTFKVVTTPPTSQGCTEIILNKPQLITVAASDCSVTRRAVGAVIHSMY